jgi:Holliday junction resolvase-like predicted endonuclease
MAKYALLAIAISVTGLLFLESRFMRQLPSVWYLLLVPGLFYIYVRTYWSFFKTSRNYEKGLEGEAVVAKEICKLPAGYFGFHDVKFSDQHGNVDFVVVTPSHLYAIEVKNTERPWIAHATSQVRRQAKALNVWIKQETALDIFAQPLVVFTNSKAKFHSGMRYGTGVVSVSTLNEFIADKTGKSYGADKMRLVISALKKFTPVHEVVCD